MIVCFHGDAKAVLEEMLARLAQQLVEVGEDTKFIIGSSSMFDVVRGAVDPRRITYLLRYDSHPPAPVPLGVSVGAVYDCYELSIKVAPVCLEWENHWALSHGIGQGLMIARADAFVVAVSDDPDTKAFLNAVMVHNAFRTKEKWPEQPDLSPKPIALIGPAVILNAMFPERADFILAVPESRRGVPSVVTFLASHV